MALLYGRSYDSVPWLAELPEPIASTEREPQRRGHMGARLRGHRFRSALGVGGRCSAQLYDQRPWPATNLTRGQDVYSNPGNPKLPEPSSTPWYRTPAVLLGWSSRS